MSTGGVNYMLAVVMIAMLFGVLWGYRKGFLRLLVHFAGLIVVIALVTKVSPMVSRILIENTGMYDDVRQKIITIYSEKNSERDNSIVENQNDTISSYDLPDLIAGALVTNNTQDMYGLLVASLFEEYIAGYLARMVIKAGSFVGLFVIFGIIMLIILGTIKIIEKIPVFRTFNRLLGMVAGLGFVTVIIWVFFIGIMMFFTDSLGGWMLAQVKSSQLLSFLFNNNMLFKVLL